VNRIPIAVLLAITVALTSPGRATGQEAPAATVEDVVVIARRSGAPVWRVQTPSGAVILVGSIRSVPDQASWRPESLEEAVALADRIVLSQSATMSLGDFLRFRRAKERLPEGTVVADYIDADEHERLQRIGAHYRQDYGRRGLVAIADDLLDRRLRYDRGAGISADSVVRSAARRSRRPVTLVGDLNGRHIDDSIASPDEGQVECLSAAITAVEAGPDGIRARGLAWARQDVPAVVASRLERALDRCAWFADETLRAQGKAQWTAALGDALGETGTVMIVAPITIMAEAGGLLDYAERRGFEVLGPEWKAGAEEGVGPPGGEVDSAAAK
jgi:hypothetical protein